MKAHDLFKELGVMAEEALLSDNESLFIGGFAGGGLDPMDTTNSSGCVVNIDKCTVNSKDCVVNTNCTCPENRSNCGCGLTNSGTPCVTNIKAEQCSKNL